MQKIKILFIALITISNFVFSNPPENKAKILSIFFGRSFCPKCQKCFQNGSEQCSSCKADLIKFKEPKHTHLNQYQIHLICSGCNKQFNNRPKAESHVVICGK